MEIKKPYKIAIIAPVPFYYHIPLYRKLAESPEIDSMVYYCSDETLHGTDVEKTYHTKGNFVNKEDLLRGYNYKFLRNYTFTPSYLSWPFGLVNFGIWAEIKKGKYDAVVLQSWTNTTWWLAFLACIFFKTRILFMTDSNVSSEQSKPIFKKYVKKIILGNFLFRNADGFLTSGTANEEFYKYYGVPFEKMVRVPFSWGYEDLLKKGEKLKQQRQILRKSFGITDDMFVILYVGRLSREKSPLCVLKAYRNINTAHKKLFLVGDGPMHQEVLQKIEELKIKEVELVGFKSREAVFNFYAMADVLVLPSAHETWGIVINEAMCFGLPIIASDRVGAAVDLVRNGYNGFIFKSQDIKDLTLKLEHLAELPDKERKIFGDRSKDIMIKWLADADPVKQIIKIMGIVKTSKNSNIA